MSLVQLTRAAALGIACLRGVPAIDTVDDLIVDKYLGRWYQAFGNAFTAQTITRDSTCIAADYGLDEATGNITVINSDREHIPSGELNTITGYAYSVNESEPGQLKVHLGQVPEDGDYWIVALGPATFGPDEAYEWAIVSGPEALTLFILVRDVPRFHKMYAKEVLALVKNLGFTGPLKSPQRIVQEGCLPFDPNTTTSGTEEMPEWVNFLQTAQDGGGIEHAKDVGQYIRAQTFQDLNEERNDFMQNFWSKPVITVAALDVDRYTGRWYQAYSSLTVSALLEKNGACVTADYAKQENGTVSVVNTARAGGIDGEAIEMAGYAYYKNESEPGKLTVHLDGVPVDAPYWVLAVGDEDGDGLYSWSIVSDPLRFFLFVLVRDPETFFGSQHETDVLVMCKDLGFTSFWNTPKETVQIGCEYPSNLTLFQGEEITTKILPKPNLRRKLGLGAPLHASCKMTIKFPDDTREKVIDALVSAADAMSGFDKCNGGNKCGYTVSKVTDDSIALVHETSVMHYKDDLTFTFVKEGNSGEAAAFSTSQTWYAILDNSVNYCNLHNLVETTGLSYEEVDVSDEVCTQFSSADCERY